MKILNLSFLAVLGIILLAGGLSANAGESKATPGSDVAKPSNIFGVIEIGGSGVKAMAFEKNASASGQVTIKFVKKYEPIDANAFSWTAASSGLVVSAVEDSVKKMQSDFHIPDNHVSIVGSSGVPQENRQALIDLLNKDLHLGMDYISVEQESQLVFENIVPAEDYKRVTVLDIGSGNSKGSYADVQDEGTRFVYFNIPFGTKTFAQEIDSQRKDGAFLITAEALRKEIIQPAVRDNVQIAPGMQHRKRIYLVGGLPWAMTSLLHPFTAQDTLVKLTPKEIDAFLSKAIQSPRDVLQPDLAQAPDQPTEDVEKARKKAADTVAKIGSTFTDNQFIAGAIILKTYLEEMDYEDKDVYFYSQALYAWPQQYIINKTPVAPGK